MPSVAPYACTDVGIDCDGGSAFDQCADPQCQDSDDSSDGCSSDGFTSYTVTVATCTVVAEGEVDCDTGGTHCMYTLSSASGGFLGCGIDDDLFHYAEPNVPVNDQRSEKQTAFLTRLS